MLSKNKQTPGFFNHPHQYDLLTHRETRLKQACFVVARTGVITLLVGFSKTNNLLALIEPYLFLPAPFMTLASLGFLGLHGVELSRERKLQRPGNLNDEELGLMLNEQPRVIKLDKKQSALFRLAVSLRMAAGFLAVPTLVGLSATRFVPEAYQAAQAQANTGIFGAIFGLGMISDTLETVREVLASERLNWRQKTYKASKLLLRMAVFASYIGGSYANPAYLLMTVSLLAVHGFMAMLPEERCTKGRLEAMPEEPDANENPTKIEINTLGGL